jgi:large subunit ribosomal protein L30
MAKASKKAESKIKIQWYRSTIGANRSQKELVRSLGLTKLNQVVERPDTASTRGMVAKVPHLLRIVD